MDAHNITDRSRHEKSTRKSLQVLHSGLFKTVDPAGLEPATPWTRLGLNQRPPDYESGATNRLSYGS